MRPEAQNEYHTPLYAAAAQSSAGTEQARAWSASTHDEIIKRLMTNVGMPNSISLYGAFKQFANELHALAHAAPQDVDAAQAPQDDLKSFWHRTAVTLQEENEQLREATQAVPDRAAIIEECAKVCEDLRHDDYSAETSDWSGGTFDCARAIRALALSSTQSL